MQQRTRHRRSDPCVREPQSGGRWGPSPTSCLSQDGPLTRPLSPLALLWRGRPPSRLQRLKKGSSWPLLWQEGSEGRSLQRVQWSQISSARHRGVRGDSSVGGRSPHLRLLGLLRGDKGVQSPRPRWKPHNLSRRGLLGSQVSGCVCRGLMYHLRGVRGGER